MGISLKLKFQRPASCRVPSASCRFLAGSIRFLGYSCILIVRLQWMRRYREASSIRRIRLGCQAFSNRIRSTRLPSSWEGTSHTLHRPTRHRRTGPEQPRTGSELLARRHTATSVFRPVFCRLPSRPLDLPKLRNATKTIVVF